MSDETPVAARPVSGGTTAPPGSDDVPVAPALRRWFAEALDDPGPFALRRLSGGNSNETLLLESPAARRVIRRPPPAAVAPGAHDMAREHRVLTGLERGGAPAPRPLALCSDPHVAPAPFLVMDHVPGHAIFDVLPAGLAADAATARALGEGVIDALVALHAVDLEASGLADLGRPEGFLERQVPRWRAQYARVQVRELPVFEEVAARLEATRPDPIEPALLHGDFRLDNCLVDPDDPGRVAAVIDWEMATVGDPLLDLGLVLGFWGDDRPERPAMPRLQGVSRVPGAPRRAELAARYAAASGRSVEHLDWYMALAFFKLAAIVEGSYANHVAGRLDNDYGRGLEHDVPQLLVEAAGFLPAAA